MRGKILGIDAAAGTGAISGSDGKRYSFTREQWRGEGVPQPGIYVDFDSSDGSTATDLFPEVKTIFQPAGGGAASPPPPPPPPPSASAESDASAPSQQPPSQPSHRADAGGAPAAPVAGQGGPPPLSPIHQPSAAPPQGGGHGGPPPLSPVSQPNPVPPAPPQLRQPSGMGQGFQPPAGAPPQFGGQPQGQPPHAQPPHAQPHGQPPHGQAFPGQPPARPPFPGQPPQGQPPYPPQGYGQPPQGQGYQPPGQGHQPGYPGQQGYPGQAYPGSKSKVVAGLLAIFLGGLGAHKFYLGYNTEGIILLVANIVSFFLWIIVIGLLGTSAIGLIVFIEGIIYLTKSDADFERTYVQNKKAWF